MISFNCNNHPLLACPQNNKSLDAFPACANNYSHGISKNRTLIAQLLVLITMTGTETPLRKTEEHRSFLFLAIIWLLFVVLGRGSCINHHVCKNAFVEFVSISESHIAGIVVHASQSDLENIKQAISLLPGPRFT